MLDNLVQDLREKNWKAMDAVAVTEKSAAVKCTRLQVKIQSKIFLLNRYCLTCVSTFTPLHLPSTKRKVFEQILHCKHSKMLIFKRCTTTACKWQKRDLFFIDLLRFCCIISCLLVYKIAIKMNQYFT